MMAVTEKPADDDDVTPGDFEIADVLDTDARASLIAEAITVYGIDWPARASRFFRDLNRDEARWFG